MADPYLTDDESVILATEKILFRSVTLPAVILTNRRVLLLQIEGEDISAEEILLSQIQTAVSDLRPDSDPVLTVTYRPVSGEPVQESLTFLTNAPKPRTEECRAWAEKISGQIGPAAGGGTILRIPPTVKEPAASPAGAPAPVPTTPPAAGAAAQAGFFGEKPAPAPAPSAGGILAKHDRPADLAFPPMPKIPVSELADSPPPAPPSRSRIKVVAAIVLIVVAVVCGAFLVTQFFGGKPAAPAAPVAPGPITTTAPPVPSSTASVTETAAPIPPVTQIPPGAANETSAPAPVATATPAATPPPALPASGVPIPATGVWVRIQDVGKFAGTVGAGGVDLPVSGTGEQFYQLVTKTGTVRAIIQKTEGSGDLLTVDIYQDGTLAGHGETRAPFGEVNLQFELPAVTPAVAAATTTTGTR